MLKIFLSAKDKATIDMTFGAALKRLRPSVPDHEFVLVSGDFTPSPTEGGVVLVSGKKAYEALAAKKVFPKNKSHLSMRGTPAHHSNGGIFLTTLDPFNIISEADTAEQIAWDVMLAYRFMKTGTLKAKVGKYKWVGSYAPMIAEIEKRYEKTGQPVDIAGDLETMGFDPWKEGAQIVSLSFTLDPGTAELLYTGPNFADPVAIDHPKEIMAQVEWLMTSPKVRSRWANGKFDMKWLRVCWGMTCTNFKFDPLLVGSLLDENRSCSLNNLTKIELPFLGGYDDHFNETHDKGHFENIPPNDEFLEYAGGDTDATQQLSDKLKGQLLNSPPLARLYVELLHPAARTFERIEERGIMIDRHKYEGVRDEAKKEIKRLTNECMNLLPNRLKLKFKDKIESQAAAGKSPLTPQIKGEYFFTDLGLNLKPKMVTEKSGKPSTAAAHFEMFHNVDEAKEMYTRLKELGQAEKILSTYCDGFLKHLRDDDKFHPSYFLFNGQEGYEKGDGGTTTGRLSAIDPAIQTVPKHSKWGKMLRSAFIAPDGYLMYECDFSQGELRVAACVAPDKRMIAAYKEGMDLHGITGALAAGLTYEQVVEMKKSKDKALKQMAKDIRQKGKAGNFGLLYGMSAGGFQEYARIVYGVIMTFAEAEAFRHKFLYEQWTGLPKYHDRIKKYVGIHGKVVSPLGRVRNLPLINSKDQYYSSQAARQAINSPIQSTLSDIMLLSLVELENNFDQDTIYSTMVIHDASVGCVKKSKAVETMKQVTDMMGSLDFSKFDWNPELNFPADSSLGVDWGHMMEEDEYMAAIANGELVLA